MHKKVFLLLFATLLLAGCSNIFKKEYFNGEWLLTDTNGKERGYLVITDDEVLVKGTGEERFNFERVNSKQAFIEHPVRNESYVLLYEDGEVFLYTKVYNLLYEDEDLKWLGEFLSTGSRTD